MSDEFKNRGSRLQGSQSFKEHTEKLGTIGREPSKNPLGNDENGSCFWAKKDNMNPIWRYHDSNIAEQELGFDEQSMNGQKFYRIDCDDLSAHNQRIASGFEQGVNDKFTGIVCTDEKGNKIIDPKIYNQRTSGGQLECVTDPIPLNNCSVSKPKKFDDPNQLTEAHCDRANSIASMPEGNTKKTKLNQWNSKADTLQNRMSGEQDYLKSRINDHEKRMSQFPAGSLEYNRAKENRDWCQNYYNDLEDSKNNLQAKQSALINSNSQLSGQLPESKPLKTDENPQISGTLSDQAQSIDLPNSQSAGKSGSSLAEDETKNSGVFEPNNDI